MEHILFLNAEYPLEPLCRALRAGGVVSTVTESVREFQHLARIRPWSLCVVAAEGETQLELLSDLVLPDHCALLVASPEVSKSLQELFFPVWVGNCSATSILRAARYSALMVADGGVDIAAGRLLVSRNEHGTWWEGRELDLTPRQFDILSLLASQPGRSFSRVEIWEHCWGLADFPQSNAIDAHVRRIRGKVPEGLRRCIKSAYGVGYRFLPYGWQVTNVTEEELVFPEEVAQAASQLTAAV